METRTNRQKMDRQRFISQVSKVRSRVGLPAADKMPREELDELFARHLSFEPAAEAAVVATDYELEALLREHGL